YIGTALVATFIVVRIACLPLRPTCPYTVMDAFLKQWDNDINDPRSDKHQLFEDLCNKLNEDSRNVELYWRLVQASLVLASFYEKTGNKVDGKKYTEESVKWAKKAVEYGPGSLDANKW